MEIEAEVRTKAGKKMGKLSAEGSRPQEKRNKERRKTGI
jgi:hypothetical protein